MDTLRAGARRFFGLWIVAALVIAAAVATGFERTGLTQAKNIGQALSPDKRSISDSPAVMAVVRGPRQQIRA